LDVGFFAPDGIGDPLGILGLSLANSDLALLDRLLVSGHLFLADRDAVGLTLADRLIGWLAGAGAALDVYFLVGDGHVHRLLLAHHVFTQACLSCLHRLLLHAQLLLT